MPVRDRPYFLWDVDITETELRERLKQPDRDARAQWQARIMREACIGDVWSYLTLDEILRDWRDIYRHLGRRRGFWVFLIAGWRHDGLIPA